MTAQTSSRDSRAHRRPSLRMMQPEEMKTKAYVYGVEKLNGYDAWALFKACAAGDMPKVQALVAKDQRLINAQFFYQFPIHMAVREGHAAYSVSLHSYGFKNCFRISGALAIRKSPRVHCHTLDV